MSHDLDHVGQIREQWARERPDVDTSAMDVIGRLHRLAEELHRELRPVFAAAGLTDGEFDVLAALRRHGAPFELTPSQLADTTMITSGTVTKRVDRLAAAGLVTRTRADHDGRVRRIALTERGCSVVDDLVGAHYANEERLLSTFSETERDQLTRLLRQWTHALGV